jgi:succinate dehydrogenase/fumarate reductase flavoprotein subunit
VDKIGNYTIIDHTYDAIVVGAGGAGLRVRTLINRKLNVGCFWIG